MPVWAWVISIIAGAFALLLFLFRIRYRFDWNGGSEWSGAFEFGIPGFMKKRSFPTTTPSVSETEATTAAPEKKTVRRKLRKLSPAFFLFVTDPTVLRGLTGYALRFTRRAFALLNLELTFTVSHSDPATLGKMAGYWYAAKPLLPMERLNFRFDFENPKFSLGLHAKGGFSAASALLCVLMALVSFPVITLLRRAWWSRRHAQLSGWRAWAYNRLWKAPRMHGIS